MSGIRDLAAADAAEVAAMVAELIRHEGHDPQQGPDAAALRAAYLGASARGRLLVAEVPDGLGGYVTFHVTYETAHAAPGAYLGDLYVRPAFRRRGLGRALVAAAARAVRAGGGNHLWWTALPGNLEAQAFYRRLGAEGEPIMAYALARDAFGRLAE